jgi:flagellar hook-associated protein 1 FlgK
LNFFNPANLTADSISLSEEVKSDVANIAAAAHEDSPGDNEIALALASLRDTLTMENNTATFGDFYSSLVGLVGVQAQQAVETKESFELVLEQIEFSRQSVQGVSLDEEMANMIRAQHAFDAAARLVVTIDEAMGTIVNELGVG